MKKTLIITILLCAFVFSQAQIKENVVRMETKTSTFIEKYYPKQLIRLADSLPLFRLTHATLVGQSMKTVFDSGWSAVVAPAPALDTVVPQYFVTLRDSSSLLPTKYPVRALLSEAPVVSDTTGLDPLCEGLTIYSLADSTIWQHTPVIDTVAGSPTYGDTIGCIWVDVSERPVVPNPVINLSNGGLLQWSDVGSISQKTPVTFIKKMTALGPDWIIGVDTTTTKGVATQYDIIARDTIWRSVGGALTPYAYRYVNVPKVGQLIGAADSIMRPDWNNGGRLVMQANPDCPTVDTNSLSNRINLKQNIADTTTKDATRYWVNQGYYAKPDTTSILLSQTRAASTYEPKIGVGTTNQYWSGDKSWQNLGTWSQWTTASPGITYNDTAKVDALMTGKIVGGTDAGNYVRIVSTTGSGTASGTAFQVAGGVGGATNIFTALNDGKVGIGTTNPAAVLEVVSSAFPAGSFVRTTTVTGSTDWSSTANGIASGYSLRTKTSGDMADGFGGGLVFSIQDNASGSLLTDGIIGRILSRRDGADNSGAIQFCVTGGNAAQPTMTLRSSGNVGIGTTAPVVKLDVNGGIRVSGTDTTGVGSTAKVGTIQYFNGHFYGLVGGTPPTWKQLNN